MWRRDKRPTGTEAPMDEAAQRAARQAVWISQLYARNWMFITPEVQAALQRKVLFAAGVGGASHIVTLACRTGITKFIVADDDNVEVSNLNRQAYQVEHLDQNKAAALADILRSISPDVSVEVMKGKITEQNYMDGIARSDFVINSVDFEQPAFLLLNRVAQAAGKTVLLPLNLGWIGVLLVFTPESPTLDQFLGIRTGQVGGLDVASRLLERVVTGLPLSGQQYLAEPLKQFAKRDKSWPGDPQLGAAVYATAAVAMRVIVAATADEPLRIVPEVVFVDLFGQVTPGEASASAGQPAAPPKSDMPSKSDTASNTIAADPGDAPENAPDNLEDEEQKAS